jgi:hypothetical protein
MRLAIFTAANISLNDLAVVEANSDAHGLSARMGVFFIPAIDRLDNLKEHAAPLVASRTLVKGGPKNAISPLPRNLSIDP